MMLRVARQAGRDKFLLIPTNPAPTIAGMLLQPCIFLHTTRPMGSSDGDWYPLVSLNAPATAARRVF